MLLDLFFLLEGSAEVPDADVGFSRPVADAPAAAAFATGATISVTVVEEA